MPVGASDAGTIGVAAAVPGPGNEAVGSVGTSEGMAEACACKVAMFSVGGGSLGMMQARTRNRVMDRRRIRRMG